MDEILFRDLTHLLRTRAGGDATRTAYTFLADGEEKAFSVSYGELHARAAALAVGLRDRVAPGDRVMLLLPSGTAFIESFFGCLYAGAIAVPAYPPDPRAPQRSLHRVAAMVADCSPTAVLTTPEFAAQRDALLRFAPALASVPILTPDTVGADGADWRPPPITPDAPAFLQYTSGSTGNPRGVVLSHANLLSNTAMIGATMPQGPQSVMVSWLPLFHDMGLIGMMLYPAFVGAHCVLMDPRHFLSRPVRWLRAVSRYRGTFTGGPNFAFELCLRKIDQADRAQLDLSSIEVFFNGAEPIRPDTVRRFAEAFVPCGLNPDALAPCYGLAEATLMVTSARRGAGARVTTVDPVALEVGSARRVPAGTGRDLVSCGTAAGDQTVLVVDPETGRVRDDGEVGELWVSGPNVANGYWNRPEMTEAVFSALPASAEDATAPRYLRTGDLGVIVDGEIHVVGRLKDLLIVRGRNLAPQDLEQAIERAHPALRPGCGAVFQVFRDEADPLLVAVQEAVQEAETGRTEPDLAEAVAAARRAVTREFDVDLDVLVLIPPRTIAKTSSGKIQRRACRRAFESGDLDELTRWEVRPEDRDDLARRIESYLSTRLATDPDGAELELDSLTAAEIRGALEEDLGVSVSLTDLLERTSVETAAARLARAAGTGSTRAVATGEAAAEATAELPLSDGQLALWFLREQEPDSRAYHITSVTRVRHPLDPTALRQAFQYLVDRHEALRTRFGRRGGIPYQQVLDTRPVDFVVEDATGWSETDRRAAVAAATDAPFDLEADPLLRVRVHRTGADEHTIVLVLHHIIADFWSMALFATELGTVYGALCQGRPVELAPIATRYADYVRWQAGWQAEPAARRQLAAWAAVLTPEPDPLELPTDRPRPVVRTERGGSVTGTVPPPVAARLREVARRMGVTPYVLLLAAFQTLLHRYTGQDDLVVGTPTASRDRAEFGGVFGYFVNPVAIRTDAGGDPGFAELVSRTRAAVLTALEHQQVPLVRVVERVQPRRDASRTPLFQVMYVHQQVPPTVRASADLAALALGSAGKPVTLGGLTLEAVTPPRRAAQFDLLLMSADTGEEIGLSLEHNADLFDPATAARMLGHFTTLLAGALDDPDLPLSRLPLLTEGERRQLTGWNATRREWTGSGLIHEEFAARATETPEALAVTIDGEGLSYRELDRASNRLAHMLRAEGVRPGQIVAITAERSLALVVGLFGILKAGAAYLPLDPEHPAERLVFTLDDAGVELVLGPDRPDLAGAGRRVLALGDDGTAGSTHPDTPPRVVVGPNDAAYVIYTSGSTGRPKGVVTAHGAIHNRLAWMQDAYRLEPDDRVLQKTPAGFDVSVWEFLWPLMTGAGLVLAAPGRHRDATYLVDVIEREAITTVHFVPSLLRYFLDEPGVERCRSLRRVICSGESLPVELVRRFHTRFSAPRNGSGCELHNLYGPTEAAVDVTAWRCDPAHPREPVPIGHPIANVTVHVLDRHGNQVPVGVPGELYIGGVAPARGYLNRPELSAERFVPDPFRDAPGARLYRTGDLARRAPDGALEFLGRLDHQVKVYGNRIELGEIEACLGEHPGVLTAVVVAPGEDGPAALVAYVVPAGDQVPRPNELSGLLGGRLPAYMVPGRYVILPELPLTSSGKVDRRALLAQHLVGLPTLSGVGMPPRTPQERTLATVVAQVLGLEEVGVRDNFFELGGDSIRALRVRARARAAGLDVTITDLLRFPTVEGMARVATSISPDGDGRAPVAPFELVSSANRRLVPPDVIDAFPLARLQAGLVLHSELSPDYETYVMGFHLGGRFDETAMREALEQLVDRHLMLRTSFDLASFSESLQLVHATATIPLTVWDLRGSPPSEQDTEIDRFMAERRWRRFDWTRAPLLHVDVHLRTAESFQLTLSHPLFDGWSMSLLVTELVTIYHARTGHTEPVLAPPPRLTFADFVAMEMAAVDSAEHRRFWADRLAGAPRGELPRWPSRRTPAPSRHRRTTTMIDSMVRDGLARLAASAGASLKHVLLAAHVRTMGLVTGNDDVVTGVIGNGRPEEFDGDRMVGVFLNTIPLRMRLSGGVWRDLVRHTLGAEHELLPYRRYPFAEIVRTVGEGTTPFESAFNYIHFHSYQALLELDGVDVIGWTNPSDQTYFPLTAYFHLDVTSGDLLFHLDTDDAVVDPEQALAIREHYLTVLGAMAGDPDGRYHTEHRLPPSEIDKLARWNHTTRSWPPDLPTGVHRRFTRQAALRPEALAVRCAGVELSYRELDRRSNQLAHRLRGLGAGAGGTVGVALSRRVDLLVALFAVLKSGAAYVPLDPTYPGERLRHMLVDSGATIVLTESALVGVLPDSQAVPLCLDQEATALAAEPAGAPEVPVDPDALAYVIYTSGSTGVPKGVEIPHRALDNLLLAFTDALAWTPDETLLAVTTLSFDIAGLELFLPLTTGARLELATEADVADPARLADLIARAAVTTMQATPATWRMLIDAGWAGAPGLRILSGGEALPENLAEALRSRCGELWNVYGPTETTIWSTAVRIDGSAGTPPIGRPLANTRCHVLDRHGKPVPIGTAGELFLAGHGLARGYRNRPELTAAAFVGGASVGEERLYRTGDMARWRPDGLLEYLGRVDSQVKVRGFRIELGEIESVLGRVPAVRQAVVQAQADGTAESRLVAYLVPRPGESIDLGSIRDAIATRLPAYMMPSAFVVLDELPLTPNGKVDRRALAARSAERPAVAARFASASTELERRIADIWRELLQVDRVGLDDPFFELGGHSLLVVRMHSRIRREIGDVSITALFDHPTVRRLATLLSRGDDTRDALERVRTQAGGRRAALSARRASVRSATEE